MTDPALVQEVLAGRAEAFRPLVERFWPRIHALVRHLARGRLDADDLCQETFLRAFQRLAQYDGQRPLAPWLLKIAANLTFGELRRKKVECIGSSGNARAGTEVSGRGSQLSRPGAAGELVGAAGRSVEDDAVARTMVDDLLAEIGDDDRVLLILRHGLDLSHEDLGWVLDEPVGTVKTRLFRLRERLRERMRLRAATRDGVAAVGQGGA